MSSLPTVPCDVCGECVELYQSFSVGVRGGGHRARAAAACRKTEQSPFIQPCVYLIKKGNPLKS